MVKSFLTYLVIACSFFVNAQEASRISVEEVKVLINGEIYSPVFQDSQLIVCGTRKDRITHTHLDKDGKEPIDLYVLNEDSSYSFTRFDDKFRSNFHDGPISFDQNGNKCVVSRNLRLDHQFKSLQEDENFLGLFESAFEDGEWSEPIPLAVNSELYNCTHPALSNDGNTLVFSSNMPGGYGGYDLWEIEKMNGIWGEPENLGSGINTSNNEFFPTWIGNTIYFSSKRNEIGGLDIYQIDGQGENATVNLLEEPLNSNQDDFGFISRNQGRSGYFSSNRSGSDQLWSYEVKFPEFDNCDSIVNDDFCYSLVEETAYELGGIESLVYQWDINGVKKLGYEIDYCFPGPGIYEISVDIFDTIVKKTYANQANYTLELTNEEQPYIISSDSVQVGQNFTLDPNKTFLPNVEIESYFWMLSDGALFTTKNPTHAFKEPGEYQVTLGIIGTKYGEPFKDCSYKYIVSTSQPITAMEVSSSTRVKSIDSIEKEGELIENKIPIVNSDSTSVVHSIEIARVPNELSDTNDVLASVMEQYMVNTLYDPLDSTYVYTVGEWLSLGEAHETWLKIVEMGYEDATLFTREEDTLNIALNESYFLDNVEFENGKWEIKEKAKETLDILVLLLKEFEHVRLLIFAHTDNVGNSDDNLALSENRAESILINLIKSGIDPSRIKSKGLGESEPKYSNDTPEGRRKNRRVEFKLITAEKIETLSE